MLAPLGESVDAPALTWISYGDANWYGQPEITHDGIGAAQSGHIGDSQTTSIQTIVHGPGSLSFWWKVSSEEWFDYLTFALDGLKQAAISGEVDWQSEIFAVPAGTHTLNWTYSKDVNNSAGQDAAWLDQVVFGSGPPAITLQPINQTVSVGARIALSVTASGAPPLSYQWMKGGTNLVTQTRPFLSIQNATRHDSGVYAVLVSNALGTHSSSNAVVRVRVPARLNNPQWLATGGLTIVAADSDGAELLASDLAGLTAQVSTNLADWESLSQPLTLTNYSILLLDPYGTNSATRFYRILEQ